MAKKLGTLGKNAVSHDSVRAGDVVYYIPEGRKCTVAYKDAGTRIVKLKSGDGQHYFLLKSDFDNGDVLSSSSLKGYKNDGEIISQKGGKSNNTAELLVVSNGKTLSSQLKKRGLESYNAIDYIVNSDDLITHKSTGRKFIAMSLSSFDNLNEQALNHEMSYYKKAYNLDSIYFGGNLLGGIEDVAQIAANTYIQKARIDYEKSLTPEERKQLAAQRTNNLTKGAMFLIGAGIGFLGGRLIN